jgi:S1-C subfamily serine protease
MTTKQTSSVRYLFASLALLTMAHTAASQAPPLHTELTSEEVVARVSPSVAVVLTGAGAGRLSGVGSGVIVRSDGILLTAYHVIKDAREVQVRLKTGEIYDRVELVAVDERRDVAAIRIPAANLPAMVVAPLDEARLGESPSHILHFKGRVARSSTFVGMGTDNAGNRIAFGSPTTDYGVMTGEYWAARSAQRGTFTHI